MTSLIKLNTAKLLQELIEIDESAYKTIETCIYRYTKPQNIREGIRYLCYRIYNAAKLLFCRQNDWTIATSALKAHYWSLSISDEFIEEFKEFKNQWKGNWGEIVAQEHLKLLTLVNRDQGQDITDLIDWVKYIKSKKAKISPE